MDLPVSAEVSDLSACAVAHITAIVTPTVRGGGVAEHAEFLGEGEIKKATL